MSIFIFYIQKFENLYLKMGIFHAKISEMTIPEAWYPLIGYEMKRVFEIHSAFVSYLVIVIGIAMRLLCIVI